MHLLLKATQHNWNELNRILCNCWNYCHMLERTQLRRQMSLSGICSSHVHLNTKETHCRNSCTLVSDPWCSFLPPKVGREKSLEQCEQSETSCNTFGFDLIFISGYILSCFYYRICIEFFLSADICRITTQVNSSTFGGSNHSNSRCLQLNNS